MNASRIQLPRAKTKYAHKHSNSIFGKALRRCMAMLVVFGTASAAWPATHSRKSDPGDKADTPVGGIAETGRLRLGPGKCQKALPSAFPKPGGFAHGHGVCERWAGRASPRQCVCMRPRGAPLGGSGGVGDHGTLACPHALDRIRAYNGNCSRLPSCGVAYRGQNTNFCSGNSR